MGRVRRRDSLRREMTANVQISGVLSLLDYLMMLSRFPNSFLLAPNVVGKAFVARFVFAAHFRNIFFNGGQLFFGRRQLFLGQSRRVGAAHARANQFGAFLGEGGATGSDAVDLRL